MPTYTFEEIATGVEETLVMTMADREQFLKDNPGKRQILTVGNGFIAGINQKPDGVFRDILSGIKKAHPGSNIDTF